MKTTICSLLLASTASAITQQDATAAYNALQQWYNTSIGLWIPSTGWWNSANCLTVIADLAKIDDAVAAKAESLYPVTYVKAQEYNLQMQKVSNPPMYLPHSYYGNQWPHFPHGWHKPHPIKTNGCKLLIGGRATRTTWGLTWIESHFHFFSFHLGHLLTLLSVRVKS